MPILRLIGDVHGKFRRYSTLLDNSPYQTVQVGDMGIGFRKFPHGEPGQNPPYDKMVANDALFIRGNHDSPTVCRNHSQFLPDGSYSEDWNMMFVGGAVSIDKAYRIEGYSWWPDEELSEEELTKIVASYNHWKPKIMVTHECPESIAEHVLHMASNGRTKMLPEFASRTRQTFERMFAIHKPELWVFGHWHIPFDYIHEGTRFLCLPELAWADVNTDTAEVIQKSPEK